MEREIEIRILEASDASARVKVSYVGNRLTVAELAGTMSGPRRKGSRTLPATVPLRPIADAAPAAEAILPDPCFWSPEMPFLYDIRVELRLGHHVVDSATFCIALHPKRVVKQ